MVESVSESPSESECTSSPNELSVGDLILQQQRFTIQVFDIYTVAAKVEGSF